MSSTLELTADDNQVVTCYPNGKFIREYSLLDSPHVLKGGVDGTQLSHYESKESWGELFRSEMQKHNLDLNQRNFTLQAKPGPETHNFRYGRQTLQGYSIEPKKSTVQLLMSSIKNPHTYASFPITLTCSARATLWFPADGSKENTDTAGSTLNLCAAGTSPKVYVDTPDEQGRLRVGPQETGWHWSIPCDHQDLDFLHALPEGAVNIAVSHLQLRNGTHVTIEPLSGNEGVKEEDRDKFFLNYGSLSFSISAPGTQPIY